MSRTRKLIIAFWIFIVCMLLWQFYSYNQGMTEQAINHPAQQQFFFYPPSAPAPVAAQPVQHTGVHLEQTAFSAVEGTPAVESFTCRVTLKNDGTETATGVQVWVRPYRGTRTDDENVGRSPYQVLSDNDPLSLFGEWVPFPDLAPGQSSTQSVVFVARQGMHPGPNSDPQIIFKTEKAAPPTQSHSPAL